MLKVWEKREKLDHPAGLKNYCYTIVRHDCVHWLKRRQRNNPAISLDDQALYSEETVLHNIVRAEVVDELHAAIQQLPPKSSRVCSKLYIEGKSVSETAKELQLTVSTIKSHKRNGLAMLRAMITRVLVAVGILIIL